MSVIDFFNSLGVIKGEFFEFRVVKKVNFNKNGWFFCDVIERKVGRNFKEFFF